MELKRMVKKLSLACACLGIACSGIISSSAAQQFKDTSVTGGKIRVYATYYPSGNTRWSYSLGGILNDYSNVKSSGARELSKSMNDSSISVRGQLWKTDYNYNTTNLGSGTVTHYSSEF